jgi:hypothetical protein
VGPLAYGTPRVLCLAVNVALAWLGAPATNLRFRARESFISKAQTLEALHRSTPGLEDTGKADSPSTLKYWPSSSLAASARLVTYTIIDPYAFGRSFQMGGHGSQMLGE